MDADRTARVSVPACGHPTEAPDDAELADLMADLQLQHLGYQAALAVTAQVVQPSLLDFLR